MRGICPRMDGPMSVNKLETVRHFFVVRIWWDPAESENWRGAVDHVTTGEKSYFSVFDDLQLFIEKKLRDQDSVD